MPQSAWFSLKHVLPLVQAMPSAFQSPFPSASVPTSLPTSSIHQPPLQQQYQQHRDAETTRPGWMDGASSMLQHSAAARQSSASPSQLWGEAPLPPLPQSEPPSLPADLQPAVSSDSQDWLGMLFGAARYDNASAACVRASTVVRACKRCSVLAPPSRLLPEASCIDDHMRVHMSRTRCHGAKFACTVGMSPNLQETDKPIANLSCCS